MVQWQIHSLKAISKTMHIKYVYLFHKMINVIKCTYSYQLCFFFQNYRSQNKSKMACAHSTGPSESSRSALWVAKDNEAFDRLILVSAGHLCHL